MKCKNCRGTGERHKINWETGKVYIVQGEKCPVCGGTGEVKQTNFQRITESPEALDEYIVSLAYDKEDFPNSYKEDYDNLLEWLKQEKHE